MLCVPKLINPSTEPSNRRVHFIDEYIYPHSNRLRGKFNLPVKVNPPCCFIETSKKFLTQQQTLVQRQVRLLSYRPQRKTIFGDNGYPYSVPRTIIGGKVEGQQGGSLAKPKNF